MEVLVNNRNLVNAKNKGSDMNKATTELTDLQKDASNLLFALSDAWPYVHGSCSIRSVKNEVLRLLQKHGDFADLIVHKEKADRLKEIEEENKSLRKSLEKLYTADVEKHQGTEMGDALFEAQALLSETNR